MVEVTVTLDATVNLCLTTGDGVKVVVLMTLRNEVTGAAVTDVVTTVGIVEVMVSAVVVVVVTRDVDVTIVVGVITPQLTFSYVTAAWRAAINSPWGDLL